MRELLPILCWISLLIPSTYAGICIGYFFLHRFFILHPSRRLTLGPADLGLNYEEVFFPTADRLRIHAWYLFGSGPGPLAEGPRPVILFFPGNEGTLSKFLFLIRPLVTAGFDVLMFGYRGFGRSTWRWPFESGLRRDALAAWNYLTRTRGMSPGQIVFFAQSLGCSVAAWAAAECRPAALILEGGFPSVAEITSRALPWLPVHLLTTERFDTLRQLRRVSCPVLLSHSREDRAIPFADREKLLAAANQPKCVFTLRGEHAQGLATMPEEYIRAIVEFLGVRTTRPSHSGGENNAGGRSWV